MRYHKYKNKPGGYYRKRNRWGGYSTIPGDIFVPPSGGCLGCLLPCLSIVVVVGLFVIVL